MTTMRKTAVRVAALFGATWPVLAQCPLCRTAVAAQGSAAASTFDRAILILLVPAVTLFCGVFLLAFRHGGPPGDDQPEPPRSWKDQ